MTDLFSLKDRIVLVTGSSGHLGRAIAVQLSEAGVLMLTNSRSQDKAEAQAAELKGQGFQSEALAFDICDDVAVDGAIAQIREKFGRLDGLVNNAYQPTAKRFEDTGRGEVETSLEQNITAPLLLIQKLMPLLESAKNPAVVNIGSMYGMVSPDPGIYGDSGKNNPIYYGAGKAGLIQMSRYLACHLAGRNIRVNTVSPGSFPPVSTKDANPIFHEQLIAKVPMKRIGFPEEVGGAVQFLLSDAASYITGVNLPIDGGWTAW